MQVTVGSTITVEQPSATLMKWCEENLVLSNPEYVKKLRMGFWLGKTPKHLYLYTMDGDNLILPFGVLREIMPLMKGCNVLGSFCPPVSVDYGSPVSLYPYQEKAVTSVYTANYGILQSRAGSGKTEMAIALVKKWGRRTLFLTHTLDLLKQVQDRAILRGISKELIGTITEGKVNVGKGITFATIQTMCKLDLAQYKNIWDVIVVDECHRVVGSPTAMTQFSKVLNSLAARHKYGLSATVHRADGMIRSTYALLGSVVYSVPDEEVADKVMRVGICTIPTNTGMSREALNPDGTINYQRLISYLTSNSERNEVIVNAIRLNEGKSSLILSDRLEHLEQLMNSLPSDMREAAVMISGKMVSKKDKAEREQAIEDMRTGKKKYLFATYSLAKEGLDIPRLERLFCATPQKDYAVITQSIGRICRKCEGKSAPVAYDFIDNIGYLIKSYKKRCTTYRKNNCYFVTVLPKE